MERVAVRSVLVKRISSERAGAGHFPNGPTGRASIGRGSCHWPGKYRRRRCGVRARNAASVSAADRGSSNDKAAVLLSAIILANAEMSRCR